MLANCAHAQTVDLSTYEAVLAELQKITDAKRVELAAKDDPKLNAKSIRIKRIKDTPEIIVIGAFRTEYGFHLSGVFVGSRYFEKDDAALSKNALDSLGWATANGQRREELASFWVEKVPFALSASDNQTFAAYARKDGAIIVSVTIKYPPGVTSRHGRQVFSFDKDGGVSTASPY